MSYTRQVDLRNISPDNLYCPIRSLYPDPYPRYRCLGPRDTVGREKSRSFSETAFLGYNSSFGVNYLFIANKVNYSPKNSIIIIGYKLKV